MKQYLSLLAAAAFWTACHSNAAPINKTAADSTTAALPAPTINERPIDSFRIGTKRFLVYKLDKPTLKPVADIDYDSAEGSAIAKEAARVKRVGNALHFTLQNGKTAKLANLKEPEKDEDYSIFYYVRYLPDMQQHLVFGGYYESSDFVLVSATSGKQLHVWGEPYLSPDRKFVICPSYDLEVGFNNNGFELYSYQNGELQQIGEVELKNWGPGDVKWIDNRTFETEYKTMDGDMNSRSKPVKIVMQ